MMEEFTPESSRMIDEVKESIRRPEIIEYGEDNPLQLVQILQHLMQYLL